MNRLSTADDVIETLGQKYTWWNAIAGQHSPDRIVAQIMNFATYDDLLLLEEAVDRTRLVRVMQHAQPGWFSNRSWEFWRSRLMHRAGAVVPAKPPQRTYNAPVL